MTLSAETDLSICQKALALIAGPSISSLQEGTDHAGTCAELYPMVRDAILSKYSWNIGNGRRALARSATTIPLNEWTNAHKLPADMLAGPYTVWGDGMRTTAYTVNGDFILSNHETIEIEYRHGADPSLWPAYLVELVVVASAARFSKPVMDNEALGETLREEAFGTPREGGKGGLFAQAKAEDAKTRPIKSIFRNGDPLSRTRY